MVGKKIIIAGATGFLGSALTKYLLNQGYDVSSLARNIGKSKASLPWISNHIEFNLNKPNLELIDALKDAEAVINLAGAGIGDKRWSESYKKLIISSRIDSTKYIVDSIYSTDSPPLLINASAIGFYGDCGDTFLNESSPKGSGFLSDITDQWEQEAFKAQDKTNVAVARIGIVLDKQGGALKKLLLPFKLFAGGPLGNGRQYWSWVHLSDVLSAFQFIIENRLSGPVNLVSPKPVTMKSFAKELGRVIKRPSIIPAPASALKLILGESAEMVLNSQRVMPDKLTEHDFVFKFKELNTALKDIFK